MKLGMQSDNGIVTIRPVGKLDASTATRFEEAVNQALQQNKTLIVVDMADVPYISSAGLRVFVNTAKQLTGLGKLAVAALQSSVQREFQLTGFARIIQICDDVAAAQEYLGLMNPGGSTHDAN